MEFGGAQCLTGLAHNTTIITTDSRQNVDTGGKALLSMYRAVNYKKVSKDTAYEKSVHV